MMDINEYISSGIIEMYVMGLCSPEEKTELELLRSQHPVLDTAIVQFEKDFENNLLLQGTEPGITTDEKILQSLQTLQAPAPVITLNTNHTAVIKKFTWLRPVAAAAILLLSISVFYNYNMYKKMRAQELALASKTKDSSLPAADYLVMKDTAITPVAMMGVAPYTLCRCTMYWDKKTGKAYMMIHHLIPSPQNKKYQLWAMVNNKPVNVGMVHDEIRDRFIELNNVPEGATAFTVTLENIGANQTPSLDQTFLYGKI